MKVSVNINPNATSPSILITAKKQTAEIIYLEQKIQSIVEHSTLFIKDNDDYRQVSLDQIERIYTEQQDVFCQIEGQRYKLKKRIYELAEFLPAKIFIQISQSELVNRHFIDRFALSKTGAYQVVFKDGQFTFASRRYMQKIKKEDLHSWKSSRKC